MDFSSFMKSFKLQFYNVFFLSRPNYWCVFEVVVDWLAYLSQSGKLSSCKCRTLYEVAHEKRYLLAFLGKMRFFKCSCSPGFQKYAIENLFEKS